MARSACAKSSAEWIARHVARLDVHLGDALVVAADEAVEDLGEEAPLLRPDAAHDAEIDGDEPALAVDEEIPLVHVGVEEAVAQRVAEERLHDRRGDRASDRGRRRRSRRGRASRVPSTHSVTSTSRPVSSQLTAGRRKSRLAR